MSDFSFQPLVLQLADEFKRRDMRDHVALLRAFYRDYLRRKRALSGQARPAWDEESVVEWLMIFRVPPFEDVLPVLGRGVPCPQCRVQTNRREKTTIRCVFPDGILHQCFGCEARWLELKEG